MFKQSILPSLWTMTGGRPMTASPFMVAGIVNITPDSFSDGGFFIERQAAMGRIRQIVDEGAHMVDLGAESTRPGAAPIEQQEEWQRLGPVLEETLHLRQSRMLEAKNDKGYFAISIDTYRAATAVQAIEMADGGVDVINDVSGGAFDTGMADVLATYKPGYVLGHCPALPGVMQNAPRYDDVVSDILDWFTLRMTDLVKAGLPEENIVLDPCIGFGKTFAHNMAIFQNLHRFMTLGRPLYLGVSRKGFIGEITGLDSYERTPPSLAVTFYLARLGVYAHRVHDVAHTIAVLQMAHALP